jgi:hypothetical protein
MNSTSNAPEKGCLLFILTSVFLAAAWFVVTWPFDGINASMQRFENEPAEGWDYWEHKAFMEALPGTIVVWSAAALIGAVLLWMWIKWFKALGR